MEGAPVGRRPMTPDWYRWHPVPRTSSSLAFWFGRDSGKLTLVDRELSGVADYAAIVRFRERP